MDANQVLRKYKKIIITFFSIVAILIGAMIMVAIDVTDANKMTSINMILLLVLLIISLLFRTVLLGYKYMAGISKVIINQDKPIPYKRNVIANYQVLIADEFIEFANNDRYHIFYKREEIKGKVLKVKRLIIVLLLKTKNLDYYDKLMHDDINRLEETFKKKERSTQNIIIAFKNYEQIDEKATTNIAEVVSYGVGRQFFTQINVGLNNSDNKAYFLYSDTYSPSTSYKVGVELIKKLIK